MSCFSRRVFFALTACFLLSILVLVVDWDGFEKYRALIVPVAETGTNTTTNTRTETCRDGQRNEESAKIKAYVLSKRSGARWNSTASLLEACGLQPIPIEPIPWDSDLVELNGRFKRLAQFAHFKKTLSNKLSQHHVWNLISADPDLSDATQQDGDGAEEFSLFFEDDIALHHEIAPADVVSIVREAARLSRSTPGFFYLGLCGPVCGGDVISLMNVTTLTSREPLLVEFRRCFGSCAHAYGLFKWRAKLLYEEIEPRVHESGKAPVGTQQFYYMDYMLRTGFETFPVDQRPVFSGSNLYGASAHRDHPGIFYQDRLRFPSEILK